MSLSKQGGADVFTLLTPGWAITATARPIERSVTPGKKQVDLSLSPLRDPLAPHPATGKIIAPHGLVGQSFDGDSIAVDGKKDHYRELWWRQSGFKGGEIHTEAQAEGAIEGEGRDYKVATFFATDFKYSRFSAVEAAPRDISTLTGAKRVASAAISWRTKAGASGDDAVHDGEA